MALEIKAIPTLYGKEARRFRKMAEESERKYDLRTKKDITTDPRYKTMRNIFTLFFKQLFFVVYYRIYKTINFRSL